MNYGGEMDAGVEQAECSVADNAQSCANSPQKVHMFHFEVPPFNTRR